MKKPEEQEQPTHIILNIEDVAYISPNPEAEKVGKIIAERLFRASDGVMLAERYASVGDDLVIYGEDSTQTQHRRFIHAKAAAMFMRNLPRIMQNEADPPPHPKYYTGKPVDFENDKLEWEARQPRFVIHLMRKGLVDPSKPAVDERISVQ